MQKYLKKFKIPLDNNIEIQYNYLDTEREVLKIDRKSRAEYFRERRKDRKDFNVLIPKEKYEAIDKKLKEQNRTKTEWLIEKIDEEIKK